MMYEDKRTYHEYYHIFLRIPPEDYLQKIGFYESNQRLFSHLDEESFQEVFIEYLLALFESGSYRKFLEHVNEGLVMVIQKNIYLHKEKDIFLELLFRKAASHYNLQQIESAKTVLKELLRIRSSEKLYQNFFWKIRMEEENHKHRYIYGSITLLLIVAIILLFLEMMVIEPFYHQYAEYFILTTKYLLVSSVIIVLFVKFHFAQKIRHEISRIIASKNTK